jgi:hypothetical protein
MDPTTTPGVSEAAVLLKPNDLGGQTTDDHDYYDFAKAKGIYDKLIDNWLNTKGNVERERALRYVKDADSISLREKGIIKADEMYCPARLIDQNIRAEQPALVRYLTQSQRSIIFESPDATPVDGKEKLESDFTIKARYLKWEVPWIECFDGAEAHGKDFVEVSFDSDLPGNFRVEHIGPSRLVFSTESEDLKAQEVLLIEKMLTSNQLKSMIGFDQGQVTKLISTNQHERDSQDCINKCYKCFFKQEGIVHVCWYAKDGADAYLKNPEPLFLGKRDFTQPMLLDDGAEVPDYPPIYEKEAPIFILPYTVGNDPRIVDIVGRCKLDEPYQEGASALQSSMINGALRASGIMACPKGNNTGVPPNAAPKMTDAVIGNGRMWNQPIEMFHTPYPDVSLVQFLNAVVTANKQEQGSGISFAVLNRKDSGKTATEIDAAQQTSQELGSVQVILLSIFIREVYACCWEIYQNRVLQGKIAIKDPSLLTLFGEGVEADERGFVTKCTAAVTYIIKSSGDVDVVQRQQHLQKLMQGWEVFGKTALAPEFLKDIIRYAFPEDATKYINILDTQVANEADALKQLLLKTSKVLQAVVVNPQTGQIIPEAAPLQGELAQLAQQILQACAAPSIAGPPPNPMDEVKQAASLASNQPQQKAA